MWCFLNLYSRKGGQNTDDISRPGKRKRVSGPLKRELKLYREEGVSLYLNGEPSSPKAIARACQIAEGGGYMRDYTEDDQGRIARVNFDFIEDEG